MRLFYLILSLLFQPVASIYLKRRMRKGKEIAERYQEKLGFYKVKRPAGKMVWVHAASNGELNSVLPVIKAMTTHQPKIHFLITSGTVTSSQIFIKAKLKNVIHQFAPLDCPNFVRRFITYWQPDLGIFIDSELWPNLLQNARRQCKLLMLNGRLSDRSYRRWKLFSNFASFLYGQFDKIYPTSQDDLKKISHFVDKHRLKFIGNLKYIPQINLDGQDELKFLQAQIGKRRFWLTASIHPGEFHKILATHIKLKKIFPDLLTLIAPRHFYNSQIIKRNAQELDLRSKIHSQANSIAPEDDIYIFDRISNFLLLYQLADIVLVGGSLIPHGGQNMLEPARFNCSIIVGPHTQNFRNVVSDMEAANCLITVKNELQLEQNLIELFNDKNKRQKLAKNAKKFSDKGEDILHAAIKEIESYI
jgi:3-deoxy-D-manno-octulosonic-acid transferase